MLTGAQGLPSFTPNQLAYFAWIKHRATFHLGNPDTVLCDRQDMSNYRTSHTFVDLYKELLQGVEQRQCHSFHQDLEA